MPATAGSSVSSGAGAPQLRWLLPAWLPLRLLRRRSCRSIRTLPWRGSKAGRAPQRRSGIRHARCGLSSRLVTMWNVLMAVMIGIDPHKGADTAGGDPPVRGTPHEPVRRGRRAGAWPVAGGSNKGNLSVRYLKGCVSSRPAAGGGSSWSMRRSVSHCSYRSGGQPRSPTSSR